MKMNPCRSYLVFLMMLCTALVAWAQDVAAPADVSDKPLPTDKAGFWTFAIAAITPLIVGGIAKLVPKLPKWMLPVSTPLIGLVLGGLITQISGMNYSWIDAGQAGALAVFVRETFNQTVTKQMGKDMSSGS